MPQDVADGIKERLLGERQFLVVETLQSNKTKQVGEDSYITLRAGEAFVFQVQAFNFLKREPYLLRDSTGTLVMPIGTQSGKGYQPLYDSDGKDILRNKDNPWLLYHFSIAVQQPEIRIYPAVPKEETMGAWEYLISSDPDPTAGPDFGYVAGKNIEDYFNPPADLEVVGWQSGTSSNINYGFYNESTQKQLKPILNVLGRAYNVHPVTDEVAKKKVVAGPPEGPPRTLVSMGPVRTQFNLTVPEEWRKAGCNIPIDKATLPRELAGAGARR